jgi:predicted RNA-binding protein (virulence factor B family)
MKRILKPRPDGNLNITVEPAVVEALDAVAETISTQLGFRLSRSQALRHIIFIYNKETAK